LTNSYLIIEIESPSKRLVTTGNQLSAEVTQAEQQAAAYKTFMMHRIAEVRNHFPQFDEPDCLVVIGLEGALTAAQKSSLSDANRQRSRLKIVGFDWLLRRSKAVLNNVTHSAVEVLTIRMT
jgi:hypothetical protein